MSKKKRKHEQPADLARRALLDSPATLKVPKVAWTDANQERNIASDDTGAFVSSRPGLVGAQFTGPTKNIASDGTGILELGENNFLGNRWRGENVDPQTILSAVRELEGPEKYATDEVNDLILNNPVLAVEGLAKLGRVLKMPTGHTEPPPVFDALEVKARVVDALRKGQIESASQRLDDENILVQSAKHLSVATLIDVTSVYDRWMATSKGNDLYDLRMAPPWANALLVYNNSHGNVWALHMVASDITDPEWKEEGHWEEIQWQPMAPADHIIEWERVRWVYSVQAYCGGLATEDGVTRWVPRPIGPLMIWRFAIYEDGTPADLHWTQITDKIPNHKFNNALGTLTEVLNMCNCVNVHVAYPQRKMSRPQRRRMDRLGVRFSEIHIKPASKSYKGVGQALADMEMPIHGVRGHYSEYGVNGKGLLFGKYAGRFFIPQHVRGSAEHGEVTQSYVTE